MVKPTTALLLLLCCGTAQAAADKIVYHLNSDRPDIMWKAITNLENLYFGALQNPLEVRMLLQGDGISLLSKVNEKRDLGVRLEELRQLGLQVEVSEANYLSRQNELNTDPPPLRIDNIFVRIIELQEQGYHYLTP